MMRSARLAPSPSRWLPRAVACALACEVVAVQLLHARGARLAYFAVLFDLVLLAGVVHVMTRAHGGVRALRAGFVAALPLALVLYRALAWLAGVTLPGDRIATALAVELGLVALVALTGARLVPAPVRALLRDELRILAAAGRAVLRRPYAPPDGFGALTTSQYPTLVVTLSVLTVVELPALHLVLAAWLDRGALAFHVALVALHVYSLAWLLGDLRLMRESRHLLTPDGLELALGVRAQAHVPYGRITRVTEGPPPGHAARITPRDAPNVWLALDGPLQVSGPFGRRRTAENLALYVDDPARFVAAVSALLPGARGD